MVLDLQYLIAGTRLVATLDLYVLKDHDRRLLDAGRMSHAGAALL